MGSFNYCESMGDDATEMRIIRLERGDFGRQDDISFVGAMMKIAV